jgi:hypothetical protein
VVVSLFSRVKTHLLVSPNFWCLKKASVLANLAEIYEKKSGPCDISDGHNGDTMKIPSGKLTWLWKNTIFNR